MDRAWVDVTIEGIIASGASREAAVRLREATCDDREAMAEARAIRGSCPEPRLKGIEERSGEPVSKRAMPVLWKQDPKARISGAHIDRS